MADATEAMNRGSAGAVNPNYRSNVEIMTQRGGLFWGLVLLIIGVVWFGANLLQIPLNFDLLIPLLVILAGLYLVITKLVR